MSIRLKIILIVVPLIIATLALTGLSSYFSATNGITSIAKDFLGFKAEELQNQAQSQWGLLVENNLSTQPDMLAATQAAVLGYAQSIIRSSTELILAMDKSGAVVASTSPVTVAPGEQAALLALVTSQSTDLTTIRIGGVDRVAKGFWFDPFGWYVMVTETRATFYDQVNQITRRSLLILGAAIVVALGLMLLFSRYLTRPVTRLAGAMRKIIATNDLTPRVPVEYNDEIGGLAQTFNLMVGELDRAYGQIKGYALKAVLAKKQEQKIKNIFQKYVPHEVIERYIKSPDSMLIGETRTVSILFSDIRSFTTISESMSSKDLVENLNRYFDIMVDRIIAREGIVDKYVGDAIMALFGAPVRHDDDALQSVMAGLDMRDALDQFNAAQKAAGRLPFAIGVGINYGEVTVGNIGTERKMDYTVIGDNVNLASRLEGLTKQYHEGLIISESLHDQVKGKLPCRWLDTVAVKGKTKGVKIFAAKRALEAQEKEAWAMQDAAMAAYYERNFAGAAKLLADIGRLLPGDFASKQLHERCVLYQREPPPATWDFAEVMKSK